MDFYEASQLHLFHFVSIKRAEVTVLCVHLDAQCFHHMTDGHTKIHLLPNIGDAVKADSYSFVIRINNMTKTPKMGRKM